MSANKNQPSEKEFIARVCEALNASADRIDAETRHKIIAARQQALTQHKTFFARSWSKAVMVAALSIIVAVLIVKAPLLELIEPSSLAEDSIEVLELMAAQDTLDMYEELEFYAWLVEQEDVTG